MGGLRMEAAAGGGGLLRKRGESEILLVLDAFAGAEKGHVSRSVGR